MITFFMISFKIMFQYEIFAIHMIKMNWLKIVRNIAKIQNVVTSLFLFSNFIKFSLFCMNNFAPVWNYARGGLRLHHVFFLERVMVPLKRAHSCSTSHPEDDKYKLIETSSMSGPFSGPPSLSQKRIHGVTANPLSHVSSPWKPSKTTFFEIN